MTDEELLAFYLQKIKKWIKSCRSQKDELGDYCQSFRSIRRIYRYSIVQINSLKTFLQIQPNPLMRFQIRADLDDHQERLGTLTDHFRNEFQEYKEIVKSYNKSKLKVQRYRIKYMIVKTRTLVPSICEVSYSFSDWIFSIFMFLLSVYFIYNLWKFLKK